MPELALAGAEATRVLEPAGMGSALRYAGHALIQPAAIVATVTEAEDPVPALKRQLASAILDHLSASGQFNVAHRLGIDQPHASNLWSGRLERFSLQQLVRFASRADGVVTISVACTSRRLWLPPQRGRQRKSADIDLSSS